MGGADSIAEMSAPSSVYENIVINHNDWAINSYTAPANGFIIFTQKTTSSGGNMLINLSKVDVNFANCTKLSGERVSAYLAVRKGDSCSIRSVYGTVESCTFIYSIGSAKKLGLI